MNAISLDPTDEELTKRGILRIPTDVFHWRGYRYSNARDALAAAMGAEAIDAAPRH